MTRNFVAGEMTDRFFILIEFLHLLGLPLFLVVMLWIHVKRLSNVSINPPAGLAAGMFCALLALSLARPALSHAPADLSTVPFILNLDWYYLNVYPLLDTWTAGKTWLLTSSVTVIIMLLPWVPPRAREKAAVVDLDNCNGCGLCFNDCPFDAITVQARTDGARYDKEVVVDPSLCASCGICVGSCPASNPFRKASATLHTGIDMPHMRADRLRTLVREAAGALEGDSGVLVFSCEHGVYTEEMNVDDTRTIGLTCIGMLPPTMVEYALKHGARGVLIAGCREGDCFYRFGNQWTRNRFAGERNPILRARVDRRRVLIDGGAPVDGPGLARRLESFRSELRTLEGSGDAGDGVVAEESGAPT
jgi:ferredoxin/coenzyme F420-reducing hydrogenase delta subunit